MVASVLSDVRCNGSRVSGVVAKDRSHSGCNLTARISGAACNLGIKRSRRWLRPLDRVLGCLSHLIGSKSKMNILDFDLDPARLAPLRECMENYDVGSPDAEWPNNIISRKAVAYGSGVIAREGTPVRHNVTPEEFALCKCLAGEACTLMTGVMVGMGSESDDPFHEFFIAANVDDPIPTEIDEALIWSKFGGTIFPLATVEVEPLEEAGVWWSEVLYDVSDATPLEREAHLHHWRRLITWFRERPDLKDAVFVRIGDYAALNSLDLESNSPPGTELAASVLPRLVLGLTGGGSLVGLFGYSVQT